MSNSTLLRLTTLTVLIVIAAGGAKNVHAVSPQLINYQGRLTDAGGEPLNGDYSMVFTIYNDPELSEPGNVIWTETHPSVTVADGLFNVLLGSVTLLNVDYFEDTTRYLGIQVGEDPEITPRSRITSVAFAFQSVWSDSAGHASTIADNAVTSPKIEDGSINFIDIGDNGAAAGMIMKFDGAFWIPGPDEVGGGGWVDYGNVVLLENIDDTVGIGTVEPSEKLDVDGNIRATGTVAAGKEWPTMNSDGAGNVRAGGIITIDGINSLITSTNGYFDFDDEYLITTGKATIGPGNTNSGASSFVAGENNTTGAGYACVSGGNNNGAGGLGSAVGGGIGNHANGTTASVGGGNNNTAGGASATVPGGLDNWATGDYSFAAGRRAIANHSGTFVWADQTDADFNSTAQDQFAVRAGGGIYMATSTGLSVDMGNDGIVDAEFDYAYGPACNLLLSDNSDLKAKLWGEVYGTVELYDGDGDITAYLDALSSSGGKLSLFQEDGTPGVSLRGGSTSDGATFTMHNAGGTATISLDADELGDDGAILPLSSVSAIEILNEPGVASYNGGLGTVNISADIVTIASRSITTPASGYVLVIATAQVRVDHQTSCEICTHSDARFGVSDEEGVLPDNQDVALRLDNSDDVGHYDFPVTVHGLFEVGSGFHTFYFLGEKASGDGFEARDIQMSLVYFSSAYGTVAGTKSTAESGISGDDTLHVVSLTAADIAAEQAEARAFNAARIERELEEMREERAKLEARLQRLEEEVRRRE